MISIELADKIFTIFSIIIGIAFIIVCIWIIKNCE
jgi:hypothetical protein